MKDIVAKAIEQFYKKKIMIRFKRVVKSIEIISEFKKIYQSKQISSGRRRGLSIPTF